MNAGSLWSGTEYAWAEYRPRGVFPMNAIKVKVIKVTKDRKIGNQNASTNVLVQILEGNRYDTNKEKTVRARDIINFWDEYVDEKNHKLEQREQREQQRLRELAEHRQKIAERQQKEAVQNAAIAEKLEERGFDKAGVNSMGSSIILNRDAVMVWLGIS